MQPPVILLNKFPIRCNCLRRQRDPSNRFPSVEVARAPFATQSRPQASACEKESSRKRRHGRPGSPPIRFHQVPIRPIKVSGPAQDQQDPPHQVPIALPSPSHSQCPQAAGRVFLPFAAPIQKDKDTRPRRVTLSPTFPFRQRGCIVTTTHRRPRLLKQVDQTRRLPPPHRSSPYLAYPVYTASPSPTYTDINTASRPPHNNTVDDNTITHQPTTR